MTWKPTTIRKFIKGFPTSACTALVETDAGQGYLKAMGGPEGPHTLASEIVATQLAYWFGLSTFDWAIIQVDDIDEIPFVDKAGNQTGLAKPGPAFITRAESGMSWGGENGDLKLLENPEDISRLIVFDTWVLNCDRYSKSLDNPLPCVRINRDNVFFSQEASEGHFLLKAMDHTHCFSCGREWTKKLAHLDKTQDSRVFGLFPEFREFLDQDVIIQATGHLKTINVGIVKDFTQIVPKEWDVKKQAMDALIDLIVKRAAFLAESLTSKLFPERTLFTKDSEEDLNL